MTTKNNIPVGYKDSAVGIIPQEWEVKFFKDVCTFLNGRAYKQEELLSLGKYPVLRVGNFFTNTNWYYSDLELDKDKYAVEGDLLYAWSASFGPRFWNGEKVIYHYHIWKVVISSIIDKLFLYDYLEMDARKLYNQIQGGTMAHITKGDMEQRYIPVPPMEEQRKIAEILGVWDEAIEKQSRLIEKLELRKRALMQRLLTGRTRLPGFITPWQKVKLGAIGKFDKGVGVPKEKIVSEGCKAITYGEIYTKYDYVIKDFVSYIDSDTAQTSKQISSGAILFAGSGETLEDIGKCVAFIDNDKAYAGGDIIIFNPSIEVDSLVLSYILNSPVAIAQKRRYGQGHSVVHIYQKDLARIELELPSLPEQKAIAEVLTVADNEIATHRKKLGALRLQKRGLMQQLLTGKTRVKI